MKTILLLGASALMMGTAANAGTNGGTFYDGDGSSYGVSWNSSTWDDFNDDAANTVNAQFTLHGTVNKYCAVAGVDGGVSNGLQNSTVDLGTIGVNVGDDTAASQLFTMSGPAHVNIDSAAAGCNYNNTVTLSKDDIRGLVNTNPGGYDSSQFQANIPYEVVASFTGVPINTVGAGSTQTVDVATNANSASGQFGAWRSPLHLDVNIPQVSSNGLVAGTYQGTVTLTLATL